MKNKKYIFLTLLILTVSFLSYCFYPVINYDTRYSQHVTNSVDESLAPGRILLYDRNWILITDKPYKNGYYKPIKTSLDSEFVKALIKIEDKNYYHHSGVNILSKLRAIKDNILWKKISGASTITEQYIKNKYFKNNKRTYLQKSREALLAVYFNYMRSKDNILNIYYHDAYFWNKLYWVWAAIEVYFDKEKLEDLTQEEIVILLSLLNNPSINSLDEKYFTSYFNKVKARLWYDFERTYFWKLNTKKHINKFPFVTNNYSKKWNYIHYKWWFLTSIDSNIQDYTKEVIKNTLDELKEKNVTNVAVFAIIPETKEVLIYQGSRDFYSTDIEWQVDVIKSLRQPWSTMKPFLYLNALEQWYWSESLLLDIESEYNSFKNNTKYISENYSLREYWLVRFKKAIWNSLNNASVRLAKELWLKDVYDFYKKYWFKLEQSPEYYWYSLVLWNPSITLYDLVISYTKLLDLENSDKFLLYDILSDPDNRDISFWVNSVLNTSIPMAVKTGTSSDFRDNLIISYHPDLVLWVWVWNNDNSSMKWVTWITWAWYIWHQIIEKAIKLGYIKDRKIEIPNGIVQDYYCLDIDCFSRELIYKKEAKQYYSRLKDNYFSSEDISEKLSEFEIEKLSELGFEIRD